MMRWTRRSDCDRVSGMLSEYLDGYLDPTDTTWLEGHLAGCVRCREELTSLRGTVSLVQGLPQAEPRRSFLISPRPTPVPVPVPAWRWQTLRLATAMATVLLAVVITADVVGLVRPAPDLRPAAVSEYQYADTVKGLSGAAGPATVPAPTAAEGDLKGPAGPPGPTGPAGATAQTTLTEGLSGAAGPAAVPAPTAAKGDPKGPAGPPGPTGPAGATAQTTLTEESQMAQPTAPPEGQAPVRAAAPREAQPTPAGEFQTTDNSTAVKAGATSTPAPAPQAKPSPEPQAAPSPAPQLLESVRSIQPYGTPTPLPRKTLLGTTWPLQAGLAAVWLVLAALTGYFWRVRRKGARSGQ